MPAYVVTFELNDSSQLDPLEKAIQSFGGYCPINKNTWAIHTSKKASEIRKELSQYLGSNDPIFVIKSGTESSWQNSYGPKHTEWLKKYL